MPSGRHLALKTASRSKKLEMGTFKKLEIFIIETRQFLVQMAPEASWPPDVSAESLEARSPQPGILSQASSARISQPRVLSQRTADRSVVLRPGSAVSSLGSEM